MKSFKHNFLDLPDSFKANNIPKGNETPSGIIKRIKSEVSDITSYVYPSYGGTYNHGDINSLVNWDNYIQVWKTGAYLQVEFKHGYVYPTSYSIRGTSSLCFATEWTLYAFNSAAEEMTIIGENESKGTTFCTGRNDGGCLNDNWATFSVRKVTKAFKYFRMVGKTFTSCNGDFLMLGGFELFGLYSIDGKNIYNKKRKKNNLFNKLAKLPFSLPFLMSDRRRCFE